MMFPQSGAGTPSGNFVPVKLLHKQLQMQKD